MQKPVWPFQAKTKIGALITASAEGVAPSSKRWERQGEEAAPGNKDWQTQGHDDPPATKSVRLKIPGQRHTDEKTSFPTITSALPLGGQGGIARRAVLAKRAHVFYFSTHTCNASIFWNLRLFIPSTDPFCDLVS